MEFGGREKMLKFYYSGAPNPVKVALFLEEAGIEYEAIPVDTRRGDQHGAEFLALNPNAKVPVIVDGDVTVFDSNGILLYLAEKSGRFLLEDTPAARGELLSWLMFVASGIGPYSGQAVHFQHHAPEPLPLRGVAPLRHSGCPPGHAALHAGRCLHHRGYGGLGLGPPVAGGSG